MKKHPGGRPSLYKQEYARQAYELALLGLDDSEMARVFDVTEQTINNWKKSHTEFFESLRQGKDIADAQVTRRLYERAMGYSHEAVKIFANPTTGAEQIVPFTEHYPPDTTACIFWLKNRQKGRWRDRVEQEVTGPNGGPVQTVTRVELVALSTDDNGSN
jgi:DNA-binding XRE family transcriptional regulator